MEEWGKTACSRHPKNKSVFFMTFEGQNIKEQYSLKNVIIRIWITNLMFVLLENKLY